MSNSSVSVQKIDNGGRRSGIDPRQFSYAGHIPERRGAKDRRVGADRRSGMMRRALEQRRRTENTDSISSKSKSGIKIVEMRSYKDRRKKESRRAAVE